MPINGWIHCTLEDYSQWLWSKHISPRCWPQPPQSTKPTWFQYLLTQSEHSSLGRLPIRARINCDIMFFINMTKTRLQINVIGHQYPRLYYASVLLWLPTTAFGQAKVHITWWNLREYFPSIDAHYVVFDSGILWRYILHPFNALGQATSALTLANVWWSHPVGRAPGFADFRERQKLGF